MAHRAGDNTQVQALGEALGWPFEIRRFVYNAYETLVNWPFSSSLAGIDKQRSSLLEAPWPDLVLTAGRRNEPIARWIRRQSGGRAKLVHVGRPWARPERWDLVVTTPQYRLASGPNVLQNETPLHRVTPARLKREAERWAGRVADLPRPHVALLVGGKSGPYPFDAASGARLARLASEEARREGGSLLVTTSARTLPETAEALFSGISVPAYRYRWERGVEDNPYFAFLGLADRIIVSADSMSMMTEACATGKPVLLYDTGEGITSMRGDAHASPWDALRERLDRPHWNAFVYRMGMHYGPRRISRDIRIVQRLLVETGRAAWLGEGLPTASPPPLQDLARASARVKALFG